MKLSTLCSARLLTLVLWLVGHNIQAQAPAWQMEVVSNPIVLPGLSNNNLYLISDMAADSSGNVYVAGSFQGTVHFGPTTLRSAGNDDIFVAKWNTASHGFAWATRIGGIGQEAIAAIEVNSNGIYIGGTFGPAGGMAASVSVAFGPDVLSNAYMDIFVAKLTPTGSVAWGKQAGGTEADGLRALAVDGQNIYLAGFFYSPVAYFGAVTLPLGTNSSAKGDMFVAKLTDNGSSASFVWAQKAGGMEQEDVSGLAVVGSNVYVTGSFTSSAMDFGSFTLNHSGPGGNKDIYIAKLADSGSSSSFIWGLQAGGSSDDEAMGLAANGTCFYLTGTFVGPAVSFGNTRLSSAGWQDIFIAKVLDFGSTGGFGWVQQAGGTGHELSATVAAAGSTVYVSGRFASRAAAFGSTMLAATPFVNAYGFSDDAFVTRLTDAGPSATFDWAIQGGGTSYDGADGLLLHGNNLFVSGHATAPAVFGSQVITGSYSTQSTYLATLTATPLRAQPHLHSLSPTAGLPGTTITLMGSGFTHASDVSFNGIAAPGFVVNSSTSITVTVPTGASTGLVRVSTADGTATSSTAFRVQAALGTQPAKAAPLALLPNPARTTAILHFPAAAEAGSVCLLDALGRTVRTYPFSAHAIAATLNLTGLMPGLYVVRCGTALGKLIVE